MKYLKFLLIMSFSVLFFTNCKKTDGISTPPDFNPKDLILTSGNEVVELKSKNDVNWWLTNFKINGKLIRNEDWDNTTGLIYSTVSEKDPVNPNSHYNGINKIEFEDWFIWEKESNTLIKIYFKDNIGDSDRSFEFDASVGNSSDKINIKQKGKE
ncbi:hypothetical protein [Sphingobacterium faecale]|uniref:Lipoprotein n=1 Tax=Sphingobacterium faecale TaxID=2803775 RepID=A0ABS1R0B6_9SPHI|nr:hypothetical protein [Sphingobacterium faecale]MBL1408133.1 hypothetical protein [Sphingobacterium faecale]